MDVHTAKRFLSARKVWTAGHSVPWREQRANSWPSSIAFRVNPSIEGASSEEVFIEGRYAASRVAGARDKLSLNLICRGARILAIDDGTGAGHLNKVGKGLPFFMKCVGFPHLHVLTTETVEGYAEPLDEVPPDELWVLFVNRANIIGAPPFSLPPNQGELSL